MNTYHRKLDEQRTATARAAQARATAALDGKARAVLYFFRTNDPGLIPADCSLADTRRAVAAIREQDYAEAWNPARLAGLEAVRLALGAPDNPSALGYLDGKRKSGWATNDAAGILGRLGIKG